MRIIAFTHNNSRILRPLLESEHELVAIVESAPKTKNLVLKYFRIFVYTIYGLLKSEPVIVRTFAWRHKIPYKMMSMEQGPDLEAWITQFKPDLIVVGSVYGLVKPHIINIPKIGMISIHPAYLPEYRGANTYFWIYYDYVLNSGVTIHWVNPLEDKGDMILRKRFDFPRGLPVQDFQSKMYALAIKLLMQSIDLIDRDECPRIPQPEDSPTCRARKVRTSEFKSLIPWNDWPTERVWHFLRGTKKYLPNLFQYHPLPERCLDITVLDYKKIDAPAEKPGKILKEDGQWRCYCRDGYIVLRIKFGIQYFLRSYLSY